MLQKLPARRASSQKGNFQGWIRCPHCCEMIHEHELVTNLRCCPRCQYHLRMPVQARISLLTDEFDELFVHLQPKDVLSFVDTEPYHTRLAAAQAKTGRKDAVHTGRAVVQGKAFALGVMDFNFMGGSMGSVVGEQITLLIEYAIQEKIPLVIVSTSGGARMQESILSLMQMAKTSAALARFRAAGLTYISILTDPTTGGVTASFASLGDIILAEPQALICFAGPRVIEKILGAPLPEGAQRSEFLLKHGMIDAIVPRRSLRKTVITLLNHIYHR